MGISQVLSLLVGQKSKVDESYVDPTELTVTFTNDYPEKIHEHNEKLFRLIGKKGIQNLYSLQMLDLNRNDIAVVGIVKTQLTDRLLKEDIKVGFSNNNIEKVQNIALEMLDFKRPNRNNTILAYILAHDTIGYGPISMLLDDRRNIEEIIINAPTANIGLYHSSYGFCNTNLRFSSERTFRYMINKMIAQTERELDSRSPIIDAELYDGSRLHAQLRPYSISGATAAIRLNGGKAINLKQLMELGTVSSQLLAYIWLAIETKQNMVVAGAPATGKTSLLLALSAFVPKYQRVITIEEDLNELKFYSNFMNVVSLQGSSLLGRPNVKDQVINALHLRPDRLIVGEIRGNEANEMMSGANLGVPFMTTMHSSANGKTIVGRLQTKPMSVEPQTLSMLDISIFMRQSGITSRKIDSVVEYRWVSRGEIKVEGLTDDSGVSILEIGKDSALNESNLTDSKVIKEYSKLHMLSIAACKKELSKRAAFLKTLQTDNNITDIPEYLESTYAIK